jgi:hypothetical protein
MTDKQTISDLDGEVVGTIWQEDDGSWCWRTANGRAFGNRQEKKTAIKALMDSHLVLSGLPMLPGFDRPKPKPRQRTVIEQADDILRAERAKARDAGYLPSDEYFKQPIPDRHARPATRRIFAMPPSSTEKLTERDGAGLKNLASGIAAMLDRAKERGQK